MIILEHNKLQFSFPEVHVDAKCRIDFQRTLRIPDDNREYPLPPGFGSFPLHHVDDFKSNLPGRWIDHGGVFLPMYQAEAMWINFSSDYPCAVKIATGKIDAISGEEWDGKINEESEEQDYVVIPEQPWLDGYCIGEGRIRQFVAMPLGEGFSAEEQLTGKAEHGGVQIMVFPMKHERYEELQRQQESEPEMLYCCQSVSEYTTEPMEMGLAPGGLMRQEVYDDPYGYDAWDLENTSRCFVHIVNTASYHKITGYAPPSDPVTPGQYEKVGLPWFDYYAADQKALKGAPKLAGMDSVAAKVIKQGNQALADNDPVQPTKVVGLGGKHVVREENF